MTTATPTPTLYSPAAEAERIARLGSAVQLLGDPFRRSLREALLRVPGAVVARHLDGAAEVLLREGWTQNQMRADDGGVCLFKALTRAAELAYGERAGESGRDFQATTHYVAGSYLDLMVLVRTGRPGWYLGWNDVPGRTVAEVLELVEDAAAFARSHGAVSA